MEEKKYKPKAGLHSKNEDPIISTSSKESAEQYLSTHEAAKVFKEMKPAANEGIVLSVNTEENKPDFSSIQNTVSETSWQNFEKIEFEDAPKTPEYISEEEFAAQQEIPAEEPAKEESNIAKLNQAMAGANLTNAAAPEPIDPETLQKQINAAIEKRNAIAAELETLAEQLSEMKDDLSQAQKDFNTITKVKKLEDVQKYVDKKTADYQSGQGEVFAMEQEGNPKKIARAKASLEKAKASLEAAKTLLANFDPNADNSAAANIRYLALKQSAADLEAKINDKKNEQKTLSDAITSQEKQLKSLT